MVLPNTKIGGRLGALAEAGVESIRIGTKELAFALVAKQGLADGLLNWD